MARFFGVTVDAVNGWSKNGMPGTPGRAGAKGRYDLGAIGQWLYGRQRRNGNHTDDTNPLPRSAKARYEHYRALYWAIKCKKELRQLVPVEEMERACVVRSSTFVNALSSLPGIIGPLGANKSVLDLQEVVRNVCDDILRRLYGEGDE